MAEWQRIRKRAERPLRALPCTVNPCSKPWADPSCRFAPSWLSQRILGRSTACFEHCKDTVPKIGKRFSLKGNCAASVPISTFIYLWAIYIYPRSGSLDIFCIWGIFWYSTVLLVTIIIVYFIDGYSSSIWDLQFRIKTNLFSAYKHLNLVVFTIYYNCLTIYTTDTA